MCLNRPYFSHKGNMIFRNFLLRFSFYQVSIHASIASFRFCWVLQYPQYLKTSPKNKTQASNEDISSFSVKSFSSRYENWCWITPFLWRDPSITCKEGLIQGQSKSQSTGNIPLWLNIEFIHSLNTHTIPIKKFNILQMHP